MIITCPIWNFIAGNLNYLKKTTSTNVCVFFDNRYNENQKETLFVKNCLQNNLDCKCKLFYKMSYISHIIKLNMIREL